jgi:hypothetical protein
MQSRDGVPLGPGAVAPAAQAPKPNFKNTRRLAIFEALRSQPRPPAAQAHHAPKLPKRTCPRPAPAAQSRRAAFNHLFTIPRVWRPHSENRNPEMAIPDAVAGNNAMFGVCYPP